MATSSFDREFLITDPEAIKKLMVIMSDETPGIPLSEHPYPEEEREKARQLVRQYLSR